MDPEMQRKKRMMMKDPAALAADLGLTFPACETEIQDALETPVSNLPDLQDCLNVTCVEEFKAAMNSSGNMTNFSGATEADMDDMADMMESMMNGSTDAVTEMRRHHKMGPLLQCLEKSPECKHAARDMKCGMAINQGRKMKKGDQMKEIRLAKEMSTCGSGKLSHPAQRGLVGGRKDQKMFAEELPEVAFDATNSTCPMLPRDLLHLKHCFGADVMGKKSRKQPGMAKGGAMSELQEFANDDGRFDKDVMAEKLPMCAGVFDETFGFMDDADMKACMDMNCANTRGPRDQNGTWGEGHEDVETVLDDISNVIASMEGTEPVSTERVVHKDKTLKGLNMCLDNTTDPELKERCMKAKKGMHCQVGQRISRAKGCDFDRAHERLDKEELKTGKMNEERPAMETKPDEATRPVGAGRNGFGMQDKCPKGCSAKSMKHLKSCHDVPQKALTGRGGMMRTGDLTGQMGAECQEMGSESGTRQEIDERPRPDPQGEMRDPKGGMGGGGMGGSQGERTPPGESGAGGKSDDHSHDHGDGHDHGKPERDESQMTERPDGPMSEGEQRTGRPINDLIKEGKEDMEKPGMERMEGREEKGSKMGMNENHDDFKNRMNDMKSAGKYDGKGTCDSSTFNSDKAASEKRMRDFGNKGMNMDGAMGGRATCDENSMKNTQDVLSVTGSCAGSAMDGLRSRGFEKERGSLEMGIRDGLKECEPLQGDMKLDDALTMSDDLLLSGESFTRRTTSASGAEPTFGAGLLKRNSTMAGVPSNKDMFNCLRKVAPQRANAVKCDFAMSAMKEKFSCDLRGDAGMKAAFAGGDDLGNRTKHEGKAFGQTKKFEAACDRADRVKDTLKAESSTCPCNMEALKELTECEMTDAMDIFEGACDKEHKMDRVSLKQQFPNCAAELEAALARRIKKQVRSSVILNIDNIADAATQEALNSEETKIAVGRAIAKNIAVPEQLVEVLSITQAVARRLATTGRKLASGSANVDYLVNVMEESNQTAEEIKASVEGLTTKTDELTSDIATNLQEEGVTAVSVAGVEPAAEATLEDPPTPPPTPPPANPASPPSPNPSPENDSTTVKPPEGNSEASGAWRARLASGVLSSALIFAAYQ